MVAGLWSSAMDGSQCGGCFNIKTRWFLVGKMRRERGEGEGGVYIYIYKKKLEVKITIEWRQGLFIFGI
jgi:hypothetical protein